MALISPPQVAVEKLHTDSTKNPGVYELRAGYPAPTQAWLNAKEDYKTKAGELTYSQENLVRGLNITIGEFYTLRSEAVKLLRQNLLYTKDFSKDATVKWDRADIELKLKNNSLWRKSLVGPAKPRAYWHTFMVTNFVTSTAKWMEKNKEIIEKGDVPHDGRWSWGPHRESQEWDGWFQYQHLDFCFYYKSDSEDQHNNFEEIKAHRFVPQIVNGVTSPTDIPLDYFTFKEFVKVLEENETLGFDAERDLVVWGRAQEVADQCIQDNDSLRTAINTLRTKRVDRIAFFVVARKESSKEVKNSLKRKTPGLVSTQTKKRKGGVKVVSE
ncbi:hypothetical protein SLS60_008728 [Paraconiothyrium brasiliense]|uniref:Uncharacterized protein n=1 Tax=Paraconiothyrium brasiliense TaxID=300254 RepID=A0ABR3QYB0_9PLEO